MEYEEKVLKAAVASTLALLEKGQKEKTLLEDDLTQYQVETKAIKSYHNQVKESLRKMKESSAALFKSNQALLRQIEQLSGERATTYTDT